MPILNYRTQIDAQQTISEMQQILVKRGCKKMIVDYDDEMQPVSLSFIIVWKDIPTAFVLPCNFEGVLNSMKKDGVRPGLINKTHALRIGWRIVKDWVEAQMAIIDAELASLPEVFLPYAVTKQGTTLFKHLEGERGLLLTN